MQNNYSFSRDLKNLGSGRRRHRSPVRIPHPAYFTIAGGLLAMVWLGSTLFTGEHTPAPPNEGPEPITLKESIEVPAAAAHAQPDFEAALQIPVDRPTPESPPAPAQPPADSEDWQNVSVRSGDSLARIFSRLKLKSDQAYWLAQQADCKPVKHLRPGQSLEILGNEQGQLEKLRYKMDAQTTLHVTRIGTRADGSPSYEVNREVRQFTIQTRQLSGEIQHSLYVAGNNAGMSDTLIMNMVTIFGWDIDFALDLRKGDRFAVIHEEKYLDGQKITDGDIIAAEFVNQGETYRAIRHVDDDGRVQYYTPDGQSMRRTFLRTPVKFSRISSGFSWGRYHPVLKRWRAHKGVDYAAPRGTPVLSTADGRVTHIGRKGGFGKRVVIKHGGSYSTLYAHLSGYKKGLRRGSTVRQGQTIGYVGSTGLATGPHLHYEFRVNGAHRNPLKFRQPKAAPIPAKYRQEFLKTARTWVARLDELQPAPVNVATIQGSGAGG
jgi:murein DD-endopeptidase MepM/ murein hydrolase activator NlpD